jgi:ribosome-associated protein YbcJ (S4-like RNA binding protein)
MVKKGTLEKFSVSAIAEQIGAVGVESARSALAFALGSVLDVGGKVQKVVKREGQCKLVIEPGDVPGFVVFADCLTDAETVRNSKIRKGSLVRVKGKLQTFGGRAVCLSDCRIVEKCSNSRVYARTIKQR